jgi:hypothetical protein
MKELGLYTIDIGAVRERVSACGMEGIFGRAQD